MTTSISEQIRQHIETKFDGYDYTSKENRKADLEEFCLQNNLEPEKIRTLYQKVFKKIIKDKQLNPNDYGIGIKVKTPLIGSDMQVTIEPKPQSSILTSGPQIAGQSPSAEGFLQSQFPNQQQPPVLVPFQYHPTSVQATCDAFYNLLKVVFAPLAEDLSDKEKEALGSVWTPIFQKHFADGNKVIAVAALSTTGILMPKLAKGRRLKKEKEVQNEISEKDDNSQALSNGFPATNRTQEGSDRNG